MQQNKYRVICSPENYPFQWSVVGSNGKSKNIILSDFMTRKAAREFKRELDKEAVQGTKQTPKSLVATISDSNEAPISVGNTNTYKWLQLTEDETNVLITILGRVGGCPTETYRRCSSSILEKLGGYRIIDSVRQYLGGSLEFYTTPELANRAEAYRLTR